MTTIQIPAELTSQLSEITATLASIEAEQTKLSAQKAETLEAQARLILVVSYLNGSAPLPASVKTATGRKPMSPEARENIRVGLERARLSKAAAVAAAVLETPSPVSAPTAPAVAQAEGKSAKKASAKR
jgi:small-conductance mechanosensitive channel